MLAAWQPGYTTHTDLCMLVGWCGSMGSVLLAAWISQQDTTYMAAAPMAPSIGAVPEGSGEQAGATGKGYQQVTAWQVRLPSTCSRSEGKLPSLRNDLSTRIAASALQLIWDRYIRAPYLFMLAFKGYAGWDWSHPA